MRFDLRKECKVASHPHIQPSLKSNGSELQCASSACWWLVFIAMEILAWLSQKMVVGMMSSISISFATIWTHEASLHAFAMENRGLLLGKWRYRWRSKSKHKASSEPSWRNFSSPMAFYKARKYCGSMISKENPIIPGACIIPQIFLCKLQDLRVKVST